MLTTSRPPYQIMRNDKRKIILFPDILQTSRYVWYSILECSSPTRHTTAIEWDVKLQYTYTRHLCLFGVCQEIGMSVSAIYVHSLLITIPSYTCNNSFHWCLTSLISKDYSILRWSPPKLYKEHLETAEARIFTGRMPFLSHNHTHTHSVLNGHFSR